MKILWWSKNLSLYNGNSYMDKTACLHGDVPRTFNLNIFVDVLQNMFDFFSASNIDDTQRLLVEHGWHIGTGINMSGSRYSVENALRYVISWRNISHESTIFSIYFPNCVVSSWKVIILLPGSLHHSLCNEKQKHYLKAYRSSKA